MPIVIQVVPCIKNWLANMQLLVTEGITKDIRERIDKMLLKILDCLSLITTLTSNSLYIKTLFRGDLDLRKRIQELQFSANPKIFAKASSFIALHYKPDILSLDGELDLFINGLMDSPDPYNISQIRMPAVAGLDVASSLSIGTLKSQMRSSYNKATMAEQSASVVNLVVDTKRSLTLSHKMNLTNKH